MVWGCMCRAPEAVDIVKWRKVCFIIPSRIKKETDPVIIPTKFTMSLPLTTAAEGGQRDVRGM